MTASEIIRHLFSKTNKNLLFTTLEYHVWKDACEKDLHGRMTPSHWLDWDYVVVLKLLLWGHALIDPLAVANVFHFTYNLERCWKDGCWQIHGSWSTRCGQCIPFYILLWKMLKRWMIVSNFALIVVLHNKNVKRSGFFSLTIIQYSEWLRALSTWYPIINGMDV